MSPDDLKPRGPLIERESRTEAAVLGTFLLATPLFALWLGRLPEALLYGGALAFGMWAHLKGWVDSHLVLLLIVVVGALLSAYRFGHAPAAYAMLIGVSLAVWLGVYIGVDLLSTPPAVSAHQRVLQLHHGSPEQRGEALTALRNSPDTAKAEEQALRASLRDPDDAIRFAAMGTVASVFGADAALIDQFIAMLAHPVHGPAAMRWLAGMGEPARAAARPIAEMLKNASSESCWGIVGALKNLEGPACVPALSGALDHPDARVVRSCAYALADFGPAAAAALPPLSRVALENPDPETRAVAIQALAQIGGAAEVPLEELLALADHKDILVTLCAIDAMGYVDPPPPALLAKLEAKCTDLDSRLRQAAVKAFARLNIVRSLPGTGGRLQKFQHAIMMMSMQLFFAAFMAGLGVLGVILFNRGLESFFAALGGSLLRAGSLAAFFISACWLSVRVMNQYDRKSPTRPLRVPATILALAALHLLYLALVPLPAEEQTAIAVLGYGAPLAVRFPWVSVTLAVVALVQIGNGFLLMKKLRDDLTPRQPPLA